MKSIIEREATSLNHLHTLIPGMLSTKRLPKLKQSISVPLPLSRVRIVRPVREVLAKFYIAVHC